MINLLPPANKKEIRAGYANRLLVRYVMLSLIVFATMCMAIASVYFYLQTTKNIAEQEIRSNKSLQSKYANVQKKSDEFRSNLATVKQIMSKKVDYTRIMIDLANSMPPGTVVTKLSLDAATIGTPVPILVSAKSHDDAIKLKGTWQQSGMFSEVYFQAVSSETSTAMGYPVSAEYMVTFKKDAIR